MPGTLACFGLKATASPKFIPSEPIGYQARRISEELERKSDEEFALRIQGFEEDDPAILIKRKEASQHRQEAIQALRKEEDEAFRRRMERY
jgi:hypothetical protein